MPFELLCGGFQVMFGRPDEFVDPVVTQNDRFREAHV